MDREDLQLMNSLARRASLGGRCDSVLLLAITDEFLTTHVDLINVLRDLVLGSCGNRRKHIRLTLAD